MKKSVQTARISLMVALMAICAWISIPLGVQPFTMQTFAVFVAAGLLGAKGACWAVLSYMLLGAVGLPVFSGMQGGIGVLLGNTGGYVVGFVFIALIEGWAAEKYRRSPRALVLSMVLGTLVCYAFGTAWYVLAYLSHSGGAGVLGVLTMCVFPFVIPDIVKMLLALAVIKRVSRLI